MTDDTERKPVDPEHPDDRGSDAPRPHPGEKGEEEGVAEVLTREGADAPDAADIADPEEQL